MQLSAAASGPRIRTAALSLRGVSYRPPLCSRHTLSDVSFDVEEGDSVLITGATGSGKSTLLAVIRGLASEWGGEAGGSIEVFGRSILGTSPWGLGAEIGYLAQNPSSQLHQKTVLQELSSGPLYSGLPEKECLERAHESAQALHLNSLLAREVGTLSTGQQQVVALASILAMRPRLLLLDEPSAYLDPSAERELLQLLMEIKSKGNTILIATHRPDRFLELCSRTVGLTSGRLTFYGKPEDAVAGSVSGCEAWSGPFFQVLRATSYTRAETLPLGWDQLDASRLRAVVRGGNAVPLDGQRETLLELDAVTSAALGAFRVQDASFRLRAGCIGVIVGPNGGGKTTMLRAILGFVRATSGGLVIGGRECANQPPHLRVRQLGYAGQNPADTLFCPNVLAECAFRPRRLRIQDPVAAAREVLDRLGIASLAGRDPSSLSGGEQRLVSLAAGISGRASVVLLDEPEFGLDPTAREHLWILLRSIAADGAGVLAVTHDLDGAALHADWLLYVAEGLVNRAVCQIEDFGRSPLAQFVGPGSLLGAALRSGLEPTARLPLVLSTGQQ